MIGSEARTYAVLYGYGLKKGLGKMYGLGLRLGNTYGLGLEMLFFASQENILFLLAQCLWFSKNLKVFQVSTKIVLEKI